MALNGHGNISGQMSVEVVAQLLPEDSVLMSTIQCLFIEDIIIRCF